MIDYIRIHAAIEIGRARASVGLYNSSELSERRHKLEQDIYNNAHGNVGYSKEEFSRYIIENPFIIDMIQTLITTNLLLMGASNDGERAYENAMPHNVNSYVLILASIVIEKSADLTYCAANVTDDELNNFIMEIMAGKNKKAIDSADSGKLYPCEPEYWKFLSPQVIDILGWITISIFSFSFLVVPSLVIFLIPAVWRNFPNLSISYLVFLGVSMAIPQKEWYLCNDNFYYSMFIFDS